MVPDEGGVVLMLAPDDAAPGIDPGCCLIVALAAVEEGWPDGWLELDGPAPPIAPLVLGRFRSEVVAASCSFFRCLHAFLISLNSVASRRIGKPVQEGRDFCMTLATAHNRKIIRGS